MLLEPSRFLPATGKWPYSPQDHPFLFLLPPLSLPHSPQIITPTEFFYVRNHLPVPEIDIKNYKLKIQVGRISHWRPPTAAHLCGIPEGLCLLPAPVVLLGHWGAV